MQAPSDHLLRIMAAVPAYQRVLDLGCGKGRHTVALAQLGFDLYACDACSSAVDETHRRVAEALGREHLSERIIVAQPHVLGYPDAFFDWVIAYRLLHEETSQPRLVEVLDEIRRVLKPGGWIYVTAPAVPENANPHEQTLGYAGDSGLAVSFTPDTLSTLMREAGLAEAAAPEPVHEEGPLLRAIYRCVEVDTPP